MADRKNMGKIFEQEFKESVPPDYYLYRLKDIPTQYAGVNNPCDYFIFRKPYLFIVELKTHKGKSLPLVKIRDNQLYGMYNATQREGIYAGFIVNFRDLEETYYVPVAAVKGFVEFGERKSIPVSWCKDHGIKIDQVKRRVRYRYDLGAWLKRYYDGV